MFLFRAADALTKSKASFTAQYLAAVLLLSPASAGAGPREARLYRYAAALQLDLRHRVALTREAVTRNKQLKNFKCVAASLSPLLFQVQCARARGDDAGVVATTDAAAAVAWCAAAGTAATRSCG